MRTSNTVLKNWYHQEEEGPLPETSFGTILLSAKI